MEKFNCFYEWHDSLILFVSFDRSLKRKQDDVCFGIEWYSGNKAKLYFDNVYYIDISSHFIGGADSILTANCEWLRNSQYKSMLPNQCEKNNLFHFYIETNSTRGKYHIIAQGYHFEPYD